MIGLDRCRFLGHTPEPALDGAGAAHLELRLMSRLVHTNALSSGVSGALAREQAVPAPAIARPANHERGTAPTTTPLIALHSARAGLPISGLMTRKRRSWRPPKARSLPCVRARPRNGAGTSVLTYARSRSSPMIPAARTFLADGRRDPGPGDSGGSGPLRGRWRQRKCRRSPRPG
jgi:hypothetical protein